MQKQSVENKIVEYLKLKNIKITQKGPTTIIDCPICNSENMCIKIPNIHKFNCHICKKSYNIFDFAKKIESNFPEIEQEQIHYLKELLNIDIVTSIDEKNIDELLKFYESIGWDLLPVTRFSKVPFQGNEWTTKEHKDIKEWKRWLADGLNIGVKTGRLSNLLVLDLDVLTKEEKNEIREGKATKEREQELLIKRKENLEIIYNEIKGIMGEPLIHETLGGSHLMYKYDEEIPKTFIKIKDLHVDVEAEGGYILIAPSKLKNDKFRKFKAYKDTPKIPIKFKKFLISKMNVTDKKSLGSDIQEAIDKENFKIDPKDLQLINNGLQGCCNSSFTKLGGIFRKQLNIKQTGYVLHTLNKHLLEKPMPPKTINVMIHQLDKYCHFDESALANDIIEYLKRVEESSRTEIAMALVGTNRGEDKKRVDEVLSYLVKEERIVKVGKNNYSILNGLEWSGKLLNVGVPVDFKVPFFNDWFMFNKEDLIIIGSRTKYGKCFGKGTKILMYDGTSKNVEEINKGDFVQGTNNQKREVLKTCIGYSKLYKLNPVNNDSFIVNGEHILCLINSSTKEKTEITVNEYIKKNITFKRLNLLYRDTVEWESKELEIEPYFLGLWLGDGNSDNVRITNIDREVIDYLNKYADNNKLRIHITEQINRCNSYSIVGNRTQKSRNNSVQSKLRKLNLLNNKYIPFKYKVNSRNNRLQLLAGLIDSDGYLTHQGNFEVSFKNEKLAKDMVFVARSLGFSAKITKCKAEYNTIRYRFLIVGNCSEIPTKIKRKKSIKSSSIKNPLHSSFKIEELPEDNYYGFILDGDHLFLLDNFIVNHNTTLAMNIVKRLVDQGEKPDYIFNETGGRYAKTALKLGLKDDDFDSAFVTSPDKVMLRKDKITLFDWVKPNDFARTDNVYASLVDKVKKTHGFLICFVQLREENTFFAKDQIGQFPAMVARYMYEDESGENTKFIVDTARDPIVKGKKWEIPCHYDFDTRLVHTIEEIQEEENENN